jgi:hypothetical protein
VYPATWRRDMPSAWQRRNQCNTNTKKIWNRENPSLSASTSEYLARKCVTSKARQIYPSLIFLFLPTPSRPYFFFPLTCQPPGVPCYTYSSFHATTPRVSSVRARKEIRSTSLPSLLSSRSQEIPTRCIDQRITVRRCRETALERLSQGRR